MLLYCDFLSAKGRCFSSEADLKLIMATLPGAADVFLAVNKKSSGWQFIAFSEVDLPVNREEVPEVVAVPEGKGDGMVYCQICCTKVFPGPYTLSGSWSCK